MEEGEGNINLLPDDLKKIEEQLLKPSFKETPVSFHLPEETKQPSSALPLKTPSPVVPPSQPSPLPPKPSLPVKKPNLAEPFTARMDVNLIPEGTYLISNRALSASLGKIALTALALVILVYLGTFAYGQYLKKQTSDLDAQLRQAETSLASYQKLEKEAAGATAKLQAAQTLLNRHLYWTKFFSALEGLTIEEVYYTSLAAAQNGLITLAATAPNYTAVARQYLVFQQAAKIMESVNVTGASGDPQSANVAFNILLKIKPEVYQEPIK